MEDLIQILTDGLLKLREDLDNLPNYENELLSITEQLNKLESNQLKESDIKNLVVLLATGYFATQKEEYTKLMSDLSTKLNEDNQALIKSEVDNLSNQADLLINKAITTIKQDLTTFKATIKNGRDGLDGLDGRNGKDGINGVDGKNGKDGLNGKNGLDGKDGANIQDIIYKSNNLIITLTDGTVKTIKFNIPTQFIGGGGGVHEDRVIELINEAIGGSIDAYTKSETDDLLLLKADKADTYTKTETDDNIENAINGLINGASNILDTFGEVESVLGTLQTSINANSQAIANLATAQGQFGSTTTQSITTTETTLDFNVTIPSTDANVLALDGTLNRCFFGIDASFNFRTDMDFYVHHNNPVTVTIRGRNVTDDSLVYSRSVDIHQTTNTIKSVSTNTLLTIGKNGFPSSNLTIYFTVEATDTGIDIQEFNSTLTSSSQYDLGTMSYTKSESDAKYIAKTDENLFIQTTAPTLATGKQALWIDTTNGDIQFNLVIGD